MATLKLLDIPDRKKDCLFGFCKTTVLWAVVFLKLGRRDISTEAKFLDEIQTKVFKKFSS